MYHSLYRGEDTTDIDAEDLPYAVSESNFIEQIDRIAKHRSGLFSENETADIVITFDDGHRSNLDIAVPLLVERGLTAYFFITTGFTDSRPGFMSSQEITSLSSVPGMVVGSHGVTHRFFNDMSEKEAIAELVESKQALEKLTNHPCESMSFPGGRYNQKILRLMKSSVKHPIAETPCHRILPMSGTRPINRVAIRRNTQLDEFERMISPDRHYYRSQVRKSQAKKVLQKTLGNRLYYGLYRLQTQVQLRKRVNFPVGRR